jgi:hypothetical protein
VVVAALFDLPLILCYIVIDSIGIFFFIKWIKSGESVERCISFDNNQSVATITKRVPSNVWDIKVKQYMKRYTKHNPSKTIYTGATVGGVTTGGFHQTQATLTTVGAGGSGRYYLQAKAPKTDDPLENEYLMLKEIILANHSLVEEARTDKRVSHLLQGDKLVLRRKNKETELTADEKEILQRAIRTFDVATQENITERAFAAQFLTKKECEDVLDWLGGDPIPLTTEEIEQIENAKLRKKKRSKKRAIIAVTIVCALVVTSIAASIISMQYKKNNYEKAISLAKNCQIGEAAEIFEDLNYQYSYLYYRACEDAMNGDFVDFVSEFEIENLVVPDTITAIDNEAFKSCDSLKNIIISDNVTSIGEEAFFSCDSLTSVTISDNVTSIGSGAFYACESLETIILPNNITSISNAIFADCASLTSVSIPASVTEIGNSAFSECRSLTSINFGGTMEQWNAISKGSRWDADTGNYTIYCLDGEISK